MDNIKSKTDSGRREYSREILSQTLFDDFQFSRKTRFIVAYSGGCDSQVLLHSLAQAASGTDCKITAAHYNHGLHDSSAEWAEFCSNNAGALGIEFITNPFVCGRPSKENTEAQARTNRYKWLSEISGPEDVVLSAHHADDQAETFLMYLFQGRGLAQLGGVRPIRNILYHSETRLARPLLRHTRDALHRYAIRNQLNWVEDPTNISTVPYRNFLRHELLPILAMRDPEIVRKLNDAAASCRKITKIETDYYCRLLAQCADPQSRRIFCLADPLNLQAAHGLDTGRFAGLVRHWVHRSGLRSPRTEKINEFCRQVSSGAAGPELNLGAAIARKYAGHVYLTRPLPDFTAYMKPWHLEPMAIAEHGIFVTADMVSGRGLDAAKAKAVRLFWASRKGGERIRLPNRPHLCALKKLWQSKSIPPWERDHLPVLHSDGAVVWAWGVGPSHGFRVSPGQKGLCPNFSAINN